MKTLQNAFTATAFAELLSEYKYFQGQICINANYKQDTRKPEDITNI